MSLMLLLQCTCVLATSQAMLWLQPGAYAALFWHSPLADSTQPCRPVLRCLYTGAAYQASDVPNPGVW